MTAAATAISGYSTSIHRPSPTYFDDDTHQMTSFVFDRPQAQPKTGDLQAKAASQYQAINDIWALGRLPDNWDGYGALSVDYMAQKIAVNLLTGLMKFEIPRPDILPTANGGVALEWETAQINLALEINPYRDIRACIWSSSDGELEGPIEYLVSDVINAFNELVPGP